MATKPKFSVPASTGIIVTDEDPANYVGDRYGVTSPVLEAPPPDEGPGFLGRAKDFAITGVKGAIGLSEIPVGLANLATKGAVGKFLEDNTPYQPEKAKEYLNTMYSPQQQAAFKAIQDASAAGDTLPSKIGNVLGAVWDNPSVVPHAVVESLPSILAGVAPARGVLAAASAMSPAIRAAQAAPLVASPAARAALAGTRIAAAGIGEGAVMAGQAAEQIRQQTEDGLLTGKQSLLAAGIGVAGAGLAALGARVAKSMGIGDIDVMLATGSTAVGKETQKGYVRKVLEGALVEGVMEELPQSITEQVVQNYALGKPLDEGVDVAAVMGTLAGGAMGGGVQMLTRNKVPEVGTLSTAANQGAAPPAAPVIPAPPVVLTPEQEQMLLAHANKRGAEIELKAKGEKGKTIPGPDGKPIKTPDIQPEFLTPAEMQERDFLKQGGGDVQALARTYPELLQPPTPANPPATPPESAGAPATTPAPETPATTPPVEAPPAPAPVAPPAEPITAGPSAPAGPAVSSDDTSDGEVGFDNYEPHLPTDILNPKGEPFKEKGPAIAVQKKNPGSTLVQVPGGWVVRPQPTTLDQGLAPIDVQPGGTRGTNAGDVVKPPAVSSDDTQAPDLPAGEYKPGQSIAFGGRKWNVEAVAHTGKYITASTNDGGRFERRTLTVAPAAPEPITGGEDAGATAPNTDSGSAASEPEAPAPYDAHAESIAKARADLPAGYSIEDNGKVLTVKRGGGTIVHGIGRGGAPEALRQAKRDAEKRAAPAAAPAPRDQRAAAIKEFATAMRAAGLKLDGLDPRSWSADIGKRGEIHATATDRQDGTVVYEVRSMLDGKDHSSIATVKLDDVPAAVAEYRAALLADEATPDTPPPAPEGIADKPGPAKPEAAPNTIFTEDAAEKARAILRAKLGQLNSGIDPEMLQAGITLAGYHIEKGARKFAAFAKAMLADLGDAVKPYLKSWYMGVKYDPRAGAFDGLSTAAEVEAADVDALAKPDQGEQNEDATPNTTEAGDAGTPQTDDVPGAREGSPADDAGTGDRDSESLGTGLAAPSEGTAGERGVSGSPEVSGGPGAQRDSGTGDEPSGAPRSGGTVRADDGATGADAASGTGLNDKAAADPATSGASPQPALDHDIQAGDIGTGGLRKKYKDNIAAIHVLRALETEQRVATPDERKTIARYVGWGALKGVFDPANKQWAKEHDELKALLTEAEYKAARASTLNAHYTSPNVVNAMYSALARLGFTRGRVLEPSVGVGNFFGLMPGAMRKASVLHGVELDPLTSKIAAALYPNAKIAQATGFETFDIPSEYFDLAVGNPPFGNEPIVDAERSPYSGFSIHNYFFAKAIDKLRPGGLMTMVTSHHFLDAKNDAARKWIAERANLVGAVRLPNTAFKENAGTEVVTDILIFQKKSETEARNGIGDDSWVKTHETRLTNPKTGESSTHTVGGYFFTNEGNVLGTETASGTMYRADSYNVEPSGDLDAQLDGWVQSLPEGIFTPIERGPEQDAADIAIPDGVKVGSFFVGPDGKVRTRGPDVMGRRTAHGWEASNAKAEERVRGMIGLRDTLRTQMRMERSSDATSEQIEANRTKLKKDHDAFLAKYGYLNDQTNRRLFADDVEAPLLQALEFDYDKGVSAAVAAKEGIDARAPKADPSDILSRRVLFPPEENIEVNNAKDAMLASLNFRGRLDMPYMRSLYDKPAADILAELGDVVYEDPLAGHVIADEYLSGDVKTKLVEAEAAAKRDPAFKRNVEALQKVIPEDKTPSQIHAALGAAFIPPEVYSKFIAEITGGARADVNYIGATAQWVVSMGGGGDPAKMVGQWGTARAPAADLIKLAMAGKSPVVTDRVSDGKGGTTTVVNTKETEAAREKQNAIQAEWRGWLWRDAERADKLATIYNEKMNRLVMRQFDGAHLTLPGITPGITLLAHQRNAVWRALQSYQMLADHVVGAGKTFEMVAIAMEWRRLGIARKPLIAVPNHLTLQWRTEFSRLYPAANVLAASPDDFAKGRREKFFSKVVTGDWDAVIVGHSSLKKIGLPAETEKAVLQEQVDELSEAIETMKRGRGDKRIVADMERIRKNLTAKLQDKLNSIGKRDKILTFDELGVDAVMVDELHEFKNLYYHSTMDRVPGMGNPKGSDKAFDLFVKLQWMFNTFGQKAPIIGATGTPVSNSLVEMYNMQRFMQYPTLKSEGLHVFDAWAKQFGQVQSVYEVSPSGTGYRSSSRFSKFANLPALMGHYGTFADVVTLDDLKAQEESQIDPVTGLPKRFPVPKIKGQRAVNIVAERSPLVAAFMGVPELDLDDNGIAKFGVDLWNGNTEIEIKEKDGKYLPTAVVTDEAGGSQTFSLGSFETEAEAKQAVVEKALTPKVVVDPASILGQFDNLRALVKASKGKINALSLTGQANKAGLDYRLIDPSAPDFAGSKINLAVDRMVATHKATTADRGTQLVFCDLSVPLSARGGLGTTAKRWYVREDGQIKHKRGTLHAVDGHEELPVFIAQEGEKDDKRFTAFDAASGLRLRSDFRTKAEALEFIAKTAADAKLRERWMEGRDQAGGFTPDELDDYNNANEIDTEESPGITLDDVAGMSGSEKFSVYDDIRAKLIARGVPENEIAFIHDYATPVAKAKLFKAVNDGRVRILLGSTPKMGAGTNVQERLVGLHHIDAPWRPSDLEQREGRIIRRGNKLYERDPDNFEVEIYRYATDRSYDTRRWQILEHKARGIEQLRNYDGTINEIEDIDGEAANASDMKAAASGDPLILEETKLRNEVARLSGLQASHADTQAMLQRKAREADEYVSKWGPKSMAAWQGVLDTAKANPVPEDKTLPLKIDGIAFPEKDKAIEEIARKVADLTFATSPRVVMEFRGVRFVFVRDSGAIAMTGPAQEWFIEKWFIGRETVSPSGLLTRFENYISRASEHIEDSKLRMAREAADAKSMRAQAQKPWEQARDLERATDKHRKTQRRLIAKGPQLAADQKPMLEQGLERQKEALREAGFGDALDEFLSVQKAQDDAQDDPVDDETAASTNLAQTGDAAGNDTDVVFRRGRTAPATGRAGAVSALAQSIATGWANKPEVRVLGSIDEAPAAVREAEAQATTDGADPGEAFFHDGTIYLLADRLPTDKDVARVMAHEGLGHYGMRGTFGSGFGMMLDRMAVLNAAKVRDAARALGLDFNKQYDRRMATEEVLAYMAETNPELGWVSRALAHIRTWARENIPGFSKMGFSDAELIRDFILPARRWVEDGGPKGGKVSSDDTPMASRGLADSLLASMNNVRAASLPAGYIVNDLLDRDGKLGWWHKTVGTMYNLAQKHPSTFGPVFEAVQRFLNDASYYSAEAAELAPDILPKLDKWSDITKSPLAAEDAKALGKVTNAGTLLWARDENGVAMLVDDMDQDVSLDDKAHQLLRSGKIEPEVLRMWQGHPMEKYEKIIENKFEREFRKPGVVFTPAELRKHFGLTDTQIGHYQQYRAAIDKSIADLAITEMLRYAGKDVADLKDQAQDMTTDEAAVLLRDRMFELAGRATGEKADKLNEAGNKMIEIADHATEMQGRGYAPLSRFGSYTLEATMDNGEKFFSLYETPKERARAVRQLESAGATDVKTGTMSQEDHKLFNGMTPETAALFGEILGLDEQGSEAKDLAFAEYVKRGVANRSAMKRLLKRKGIAGYSDDAGRVLASFIVSNGRKTAGNLHTRELDAAVNEIPKEQGELKDAAIKLREYVRNPQEEAAGFRALLFAQYLGGSIASAMLNATQPFAVTFPYLSQSGGALKAGKRMADALKVVGKESTGNTALDADLKRAEEEGTVAPQEIHQLQGQAMGKGILVSGDGTTLGDAQAKASNALSKVSLAWGKVFGVAEQFNRRLTYIAAYNTALEEKIADPAAFAKKAVNETQFIYNKGNKPRWARGAVGSILFTFKQYSVNYVELLVRMANTGEPGSEERKAGQKAALLALAVLFLLGGAEGLPFVENVQDLIDGALQRMGYNFSSKQKMREFLMHQIGRDGADIVMRGLSGIPGAPIDVSGRLGMGRLIPGTGLFHKKDDKTRDLIELAGPAGDMVKRFVKAGEQTLAGDPGKAAVTASPVAVRNLAKMLDMLDQGMYRDDRGRKVIDTTTFEAIAKGIGFQPNSVGRVQDAGWEGQRQKALYILASSEIREKWALGLFEKNPSLVQEAKDDMAAWNRRNPDQEITPNMPVIRRRVNEMNKPKLDRIADTSPKAIRAKVKAQLAEEVR